MTRRRRHRPLIPNWVAGLAAAVVILAVCWLVFGGPTPFAGSPYRIKAVFTVQTQLHLDSPVRIAGVDVGKVTSITRVGGSSPAAVVTMTVDGKGRPVHSDATVQIRPRLFLEGNFYVDLHPGTPSAPVMHSGQLLAAAHTSGPVQLDRVLSALNAPARRNLQTLLQGFGNSLNETPSAAADATADPSQRGLTAGESLNRSLDDSADAFKASAIVDQALLGERPHDLSGVVRGTSQAFTGLAASGSHLSGLIDSFNTTMGALAARQDDLRETIALLPGTLRAIDRTLGPLQASYGPTRTFAAELTPSVRQLGPTIDAALPWLDASRRLLSERELGGLLDQLSPAVQDLGGSIAPTRQFVSGAGALAGCFNHTVLPVGNETITDAPVGTGLKVYQELFQTSVGLASASQDFDGNGRYVRGTTGGGSDRVQSGPIPGGGPLYGNAVLPPLGTRPVYDGIKPVKKRTVACLTQAPPDLNAAHGGAGP